MEAVNFFEKSNHDREDPLESPNQNLFPLTPAPKSRDEISCSGGELWRPDN